MVVTQKQTHRSMEQNREPRNKPTLIWAISLRQRKQEYTNGEKASSVDAVGKSGQLYTKESIWTTFSNHI